MKSIAKIYAVVLGVGMCCSLAIVLVDQWTAPIIARNRIVMRDQAVLKVLPGATRSEPFVWDESSSTFTADVDESTDSNGLLFAGFDESGQWVGVAIATQGMGYADIIRVIYGYDPESQKVVGLSVLESRETPGLGDRIETDQNFVSNFKALDVAVDDSQEHLANPIVFVKPGEKSQPWQIDGITGATISSRATAKMLSTSTQTWIPRIQQRREDFAGHGRVKP